jgi:NAD-dependent deacetylase
VAELPDVPLPAIPPRCACGGLLRPHIVWFGEALPVEPLSRAFAAAESCEIMLVVGTSALVQPAASLPWMAKERGAYLVEINPEPTSLSVLADECHRGKAGELLPGLLGLPAEESSAPTPDP